MLENSKIDSLAIILSKWFEIQNLGEPRESRRVRSMVGKQARLSRIWIAGMDRHRFRRFLFENGDLSIKLHHQVNADRGFIGRPLGLLDSELGSPAIALQMQVRSVLR